MSAGLVGHVAGVGGSSGDARASGYGSGQSSYGGFDVDAPYEGSDCWRAPAAATTAAAVPTAMTATTDARLDLLGPHGGKA
jgi:hypothetical protein